MNKVNKSGNAVHKYRIFVGDVPIQVTHEVYEAYWRLTEHEKYTNEKVEKKERSFENMKAEGISFEFNQGYYEPSSENCYFCKLKEIALRDAIMKLLPVQRKLVIDIYFAEKTEQEMADELGISQVAVHYRKKKVLKLLREILSAESCSETATGHSCKCKK